MDDNCPCQLYVFDVIGRTLVVRGTIFEVATIFHGMELSNNEIKVTVPNSLVPVPTNEVYIAADAFQSFLAWPRDLVDSISDPRYGLPNPPYITQFLSLHVIYVWT